MLHQLWRQLGVGIKPGFELPPHTDDSRDGIANVKPEMLMDKTLAAIDGNIGQAKAEVVTIACIHATHPICINISPTNMLKHNMMTE
jgi:hypothetical protein